MREMQHLSRFFIYKRSHLFDVEGSMPYYDKTMCMVSAADESAGGADLAAAGTKNIRGNARHMPCLRDDLAGASAA